ncbi:MAG: hypothetical protein HYZ75_10960 [Elusimicrobia bacterium]|nr:hypothetical protein [Elusimicrobiota bacterium]
MRVGIRGGVVFPAAAGGVLDGKLEGGQGGRMTLMEVVDPLGHLQRGIVFGGGCRGGEQRQSQEAAESHRAASAAAAKAAALG